MVKRLVAKPDVDLYVLIHALRVLALLISENEEAAQTYQRDVRGFKGEGGKKESPMPSFAPRSWCKASWWA